MSRKSIVIDARIDLHGLTQDQAFLALKRFLQSNYLNQTRNLLVITGKGAINNPCVLKVEVPRWLQYTELKQYIASYATAPVSLGGAGAILVKLKK